MGRAFRRVPAWVWLLGIVVGSAIFRAGLARGIVAPFIMVDEVIWSEVARGIADSGEPFLRDEPDPGYSIVYPLLISPVYALFESLPDAYAALKTLNAVVMSLAALPAYVLARSLVKDGLALLAALLAVAIPSLAYTGTVMTENLFYPLFLVLVLVLVRVLEQPTAVRVVLLLVLLGLAFATRVQAVAIVPAVLLAPFVLAVFQRRSVAATVSRFRWLYGAFVLVALLALVVEGHPELSVQDLLGAYSPVGDAGYDVGEALRYLVWHAAELGLYVLVIPVAATIVLVGRARTLDAPLQAFLAATLALTACLVPVVALFAARFSDRIEERNLFYVAPLFLIALLAWLERGAVRPRLLAPVAAIGSAVLVLLVPFDRFLTTSAITDTLMLLPVWSLQDRIGSGWTTPAVAAVAFALAAAFLLVPRRYALVLPLLVLGLWAFSVRPIWWGTHGFERFSRGALFQGIRAAEKDWIDRALPETAEAGFLWTGRTDRLTVNENEFFNRSVGRIYYLNSPTPGGLPEHRVSVDRKSGRVTYYASGQGPAVEFLLTDSSFEPDGEPIARDKEWGITLWRIHPPLVYLVRVDGLYPSDTWSGKTVTYVRRRCVSGRLTVALSSDAGLFFEPQRITARTNGRVVGRVRFQPEARAVLTVPVAPTPGTSVCRVVYDVTPTAVPAEVTDGENPDPRELGVHFNRFVYKPGT